MLSFTLQDITNKLFQFFIENNAVDLEQNHSDIFEVSIDPAIELAALLKSLEKFEEQKLVSQLEIQGQLVFLLNQPLQQYSQTIQISGETACRVATTVNNALIRYDNSDQSVNSMELSERSIEMLLRLGEAAIANAESTHRGVRKCCPTGHERYRNYCWFTPRTFNWQYHHYG